VVEWSDGSAANVSVSPDGKWRIAADLGRIDPELVRALLALEDRRFRAHPGVDPIAVARAAAANARAGRRVSGASTITMQLVRVLEPRPRTLRSKVVEALRAMQLELRLSKDQILAGYLTFVSYGRNVEGVEAASLAYFRHGADHLSPAEIATLLAIPQDPNDRYPCPRNAKRLRDARDTIARRLLEAGALPRGKGEARVPPGQVLALVEGTEPPGALAPFPRDAPHAAAWLRARAPLAIRIPTTLDRGLQRIADRTFERHHATLLGRGIANGAAVIADHRKGEVVALVGGFDFRDRQHAGEIAAFAEPRSPGSALKPFLYAMAIERGIAGEAFLMPDVPTSFGSYVPKNYDGEWSGLARLDDSLSKSLNLPFVELLQDVGVPPFVRTLRAMGAESLSEDPGRYGLSAAVGGLEITPLELAGLYTVLAENGRHQPLVVLRGERRPAPLQALSPGAVWLTRRVLERKDRPDFPRRREVSHTPAAIHWKTGTSFGHRDALAAGSGPTFTAAVWLGNLDYTPSAALVGAEAAGPVLFDLLEGVEARSRPPAPDPMPRDVVEVEVCAWSGRTPGPACTDRATARALASHVPAERCPWHVELDVDVATGEALGPLCRAGRAWERRSYAVWPASVRRWLAEHGRAVPDLPRPAPACVQAEPAPPRIVSPAQRAVLLLVAGVPVERQRVPLEADAVSAAGALDWFIDGEYLGSAPPDGRLWWTPRPGRHEILVSGENRLSAHRTIEVRDAL
jgi:penicillin-binding protein 1C